MNGEYTRISVVTVCLNAASTIKRTIESVLQQTYGNIEYIIVDGGSEDGTMEIIGRYGDRISNVISEKDDGIYDAMNKGIRISTGDIIGILNSDDWYDLRTIENVIRALNQQDADVYYGDAFIEGADGTAQIRKCSPLETIWYQMPMPHPSVFIKRSIYQKYGKFSTEYDLASDYVLMLRLYINDVRFHYESSILSHFSTEGLSGRRWTEMVAETREISLSYSKLYAQQEEVYEQIDHVFYLRILSHLITDNHVNLKMILSGISKQPEVVIYGCGIWGKRVCRFMRNNGVDVAFFVDREEKKWSTSFDGVAVKAPSEAMNFNGIVIIALRDNAGVDSDSLETTVSLSLYELGELLWNNRDIAWRA